MQEVGWDDGRFVVIAVEGRAAKYAEAHIHDMAQCGQVVRSILPKHGYRDAVGEAERLAEQWNEEDARGLR